MRRMRLHWDDEPTKYSGQSKRGIVKTCGSASLRRLLITSLLILVGGSFDEFAVDE
jgi:hypothetical protein